MSDVAPRRLVLFAGLGADERLFAPQRRLRASIEVVRWIEPLPRESFAGYGRRIAETIRSPRPSMSKPLSSASGLVRGD